MPFEIVAGDERLALLRAARVPAVFLQFVERAAADRRLQFWFGPAAPFERLLSLGAWDALEGGRVAVVCQAGSQHKGHLLRVRAGEHAFLSFELESGVLRDYGDDISRMIADQIILLWESLDTDPPERVVELGAAMGFRRAAELVRALESPDAAAERSTFRGDAAWRDRVLPGICAKALSLP